MTANLTILDNINTPMEGVSAVVTLTDGGFAIGIIIAVFIIVQIAFQQKPFKEVLILNTVLSLVITGFMIAIEWIGFEWLMLPAVLFFIALLINIVVKR